MIYTSRSYQLKCKKCNKNAVEGKMGKDYTCDNCKTIFNNKNEIEKWNEDYYMNKCKSEDIQDEFNKVFNFEKIVKRNGSGHIENINVKDLYFLKRIKELENQVKDLKKFVDKLELRSNL